MKTQTFGIEVETAALGREGTAQAIAAYFGTTARHVGRHLDDWQIPMPDGRHWTVESDGSVTDPSAEVVSPVCRWEDIGMVQAVVRAIRAAGASHALHRRQVRHRVSKEHTGRRPETRKGLPRHRTLPTQLTSSNRTPADLRNQALLHRVYDMAQSRFAIMDADGYVATVGQFINDHGLLYSNDSYLPFVF